MFGRTWFGRRFSLTGSVRRLLGLGGFLLALAGGLLAVFEALAAERASLAARVGWSILGLGAVFGAGRIYRGASGWFFPRPRMFLGGAVALVLGLILLVSGLGFAGTAVLVGGFLGLLGAML